MHNLHCIVYNTLSGLDGRTKKKCEEISNALYYGNPSRKKDLGEFDRDLMSQMKLVVKHNPDVFVVTEIPRVDVKNVQVYFSSRGYKSIAYGVSRHLAKKECDLGVVLGAKLRAESMAFDDKWITSAWGIAGLRFHELSLSIIGVHFDVDEQEQNDIEIPLLAREAGREAALGRDVILMGDMNCNTFNITQHKDFKAYPMAGHNDITFRHSINSKDGSIDHILIPKKEGWSAAWHVLKEGTSDHFPVEAHISMP